MRAQLRGCALDVNALYDGFYAVGLQYGPGYRTLTQAWGSGVVAAAARLQPRASQQGTAVHPADLDDALCAIALVSSGESGGTRLPFAVDDALLQGALVALGVCRPSARSGGCLRLAWRRRQPASGAAEWLQVTGAAGVVRQPRSASSVRNEWRRLSRRRTL